MKVCVLRQVLDILFSSSKSGFIFECKSNEYHYTFTINYKNSNNTIDVIKTNLVTGMDVNTIYSSVEEIPLEPMTPISLRELRWTVNGILTEDNKTMLLRETELYLKVFKVMREQAVFLLQNDSESRICYYINSRVFYVEESENVYELHEVNLFTLYSSMPNSSITLLSRPPKKYSCKDFFTEQDSIARSKGKKFVNLKKGVGVK